MFTQGGVSMEVNLVGLFTACRSTTHLTLGR